LCCVAHDLRHAEGRRPGHDRRGRASRREDRRPQRTLPRPVTRSQFWFGAIVQFVILALLSLTAADADLWGHLTFGSDILTSGHVVQVDRYSFTSDLPWINHEWLAEIVMATGWRLGGSLGLVAVKLTLFWGAGAFVLAAWQRFSLTPIWRDGLLFVTALGVWP